MSNRTRQNNKGADRKMESNDSPEIPERGETSEEPGLLSGRSGSIQIHFSHPFECSVRYHKRIRLHKALPQNPEDPSFQLLDAPERSVSLHNVCTLLTYIVCFFISSVTVINIIYISYLFVGVRRCDHALGCGRFYALYNFINSFIFLCVDIYVKHQVFICLYIFRVFWNANLTSPFVYFVFCWDVEWKSGGCEVVQVRSSHPKRSLERDANKSVR